MPKEIVYPRPNPNGTDADVRVEVGWSREQYVQIATRKLREGADRNAEFVEATDDEPLRYAWEGSFVDLDRWQINDLIRHLRRARDQAFGRDE